MLFSVVLLVIGIALLLINVGVISLEIREFFVMFIPILLVLAGIVYFIKCIRNKSSISILFALYFTIYGSLLMLNQQKIISFTYGDWWKLWPVFFIYLAVNMLFFKGKAQIVVEFNSTQNSEDEKTKKVKGKRYKKSLINDMHFNEQNWPLQSMDLHTNIGDFYFDFNKAFIPEEETTIKIKSRIGDVKMLVPEDIPIKIEVKTKVGDIRLFDLKSTDMKPHLYYESPTYHEAIKKIDITIEMGIGDIRIDRV
ncbi:cell wall-active antibiotics response protein LiaF [Heyndrickxia vini]|uniref:Cell wall-active antibiotics response LiaF-like C-terminal domain-containing protein n=1 Tax=Heyndrickxia vini TaxID=1476025 RepID=A0ABX7E1R1_9BACI|nr:cell wall-active antibiotics response protein LiaF [Heyndrickxia vini]QQZ08287.1 hypothetical protein I5776_14550 [Heyndrickxia vini]